MRRVRVLPAEDGPRVALSRAQSGCDQWVAGIEVRSSRRTVSVLFRPRNWWEPPAWHSAWRALVCR